MQRSFSAGGIVFNKTGQVLLTQNSSNKYWGFPKGLVGQDESSKDAALREVKEEGGVKAEIMELVGESKYVFTLKGEKVFKIVRLYLMNYISGDPNDHDWEVSEAKWATVEDALQTLSFSADKELLKKALEMKNG